LGKCGIFVQIYPISATMVYGREEEKRSLDLLLDSKESEFLAVYGRRRVGKTFLIKEYLDKQIVFHVTGLKAGGKKTQLNNFFSELQYRSKDKLEQLPPVDWFEAFVQLVRYLRSLPEPDNKHVVFIDEMPWMDTPRSEFISGLEYFWNSYANRESNVLLVACGSSSSWIRENLLRARGGLYNRVTSRMKLKPFNLYETEQYLLSRNIVMPRFQLVELFMVMGGIPYYLNTVTKGKTPTELINEICFSDRGLLFDEFEQLYYSLFKNAEKHVEIIKVLASRPQGMTKEDIKKSSSLTGGNLDRTLEELIQCDFISFFYPIFKKKKGGVYKLTDSYSLFYLKFIQDNKHGGKNTWSLLSKENSFKIWCGYAYENIWHAHINQLEKALGISGVSTQFGSWKTAGDEHTKGAQIDLVIDRADKAINVCEIKFSSDTYKMTSEQAENIRNKKWALSREINEKKMVITTLLTTYAAEKNMHYLSCIDREVSLDALFEPN
jgi:uncharacterized protein